jgi:YidC/Oxa1 family membrane protein insertase
MEKRLFIAVLISIAFLWAWAALVPRLFPELVRPKAVVKESGTLPVSGSRATSSPAAPAVAGPIAEGNPTAPGSALPIAEKGASSIQTTTVDAPDFVARFSNRGAQLVSFQLKNYKSADGSLVDLVKGRDPRRPDYPFALVGADPTFNALANTSLYEVSDDVRGPDHTITYTVARGASSITKIFRIGRENQFGFSVSVTPPSVPFRVVVGPGIRTLGPDEKDNQFIVTGNAVLQRDDSLKVVPREKASLFQTFDPPIDYIGIEDNYFLTVLKPEKAGTGSVKAADFPISGSEQKTRRDLYAGLNAVPGSGVVSGEAFFGPKKADLLDRYGLEKTLQFGTFGIIARFLLTALIWINKTTRNYGFAIIVLTILIKVVLYPLQHKSIVSMKKMQRLQPKMNVIRDRYKKAKTDSEQRQKMNMEMMKLYQQEGISPMGGCLPMVLQLPILWGFYGLLGKAIELRGAPFVWWIHDLSLKDPYYITPVLMTITMFVQQLITPNTADATQRRMFLLLPLVFGWIFKEFPSGLVLYWLVQNILTIIQQTIMNKYWKDHPADAS